MIRIIIAAGDRQTKSAAEFSAIMNDIASEGLYIYMIESGLTEEGPDLGSNNLELVRQPKILMLTGDGVNVADAGEQPD